MKKNVLLLIFLMLTTVYFYAQNYESYDKVCYCSGRETPHRVVSYDNNVQLLNILKDGKSLNELNDSKVAYTYSQLKLLLNYGLIDKEDDNYVTKIHFLDTAQIIELRKLSKQTAKKIFPLLKDHVKELTRHLRKNYESDSEYSLIFSYILDGLIWKEFEKRGLIKPVNYVDQTKPWNGYFWMMPFPREKKTGTNSSSIESCSIHITNGVPWKFMKPLYTHSDQTEQLLLNLKESGKITSDLVIKTFADYKLFNQKGDMLVPVIYENSKNNTYVLSKKISETLCDQFVKNVSVDKLLQNFKFHGPEAAYIIFYHELMWDMMSLIIEEGLIRKPQILVDSSNSDLSDMSDLIFFVIKG